MLKIGCRVVSYCVVRWSDVLWQKGVVVLWSGEVWGEVLCCGKKRLSCCVAGWGAVKCGAVLC